MGSDVKYEADENKAKLKTTAGKIEPDELANFLMNAREPMIVLGIDVAMRVFQAL